jgi:hypothetical protein
LRRKQRILPAPAWLVLTLPNTFENIVSHGRAAQHVNTFASIRIPRQSRFVFDGRGGFESTFNILISHPLFVLVPVFCLSHSLLLPSFPDSNCGLFCR